MGRLDLRDLAPWRQLRRRDVLPRLASIARDLYLPVIRANPDRIRVFKRRTDGVDHAAMLALRGIRPFCKLSELSRHAGVLARQVGTDDVPALPAVRGLKQHVRSEIQRVRIGVREDERRSAVVAILARANDNRRNVLVLTRRLVELRGLAAVDDVRIERIRRDVSILFHTDRMPLAERDLAVVATRRNARRPRLLLPAIHPIGKTIVGDHVIELRRRLVVPSGPSLSAVHRDRRPLIDSQRDHLRILRIDPHGVVIIPTRSALDCGEVRAPIA